MTYANYKQVSEFVLEGQIIDWIFKDDRTPKQVRLATDRGEFTLKLAKTLRRELPPLRMKDWVKVVGTQTLDFKKGKRKLKVEQLIPRETTANAEVVRCRTMPDALPQGKILVCQKSDCCKRGGKQVYDALAQTVNDRGLGDRVRVQKTGCLKECKAGPAVVVLPDKTRHRRIRPQDAPNLVDRHFCSASSR
ncbi:MAG TPA: (2Fe-2S) ferredoxin domain-containing protein [Oscillatoriales cyanobacterium M59_W2019_021]|nr:(2Fe-2S) ferredoxin domain-containing protein [Oscillatoriales cyanobacterium M4454_W2019_049]HIK49539.1 (2Fe-2S) ferredoxin domain-containing protein [Oscillatoriales cyanobacterium M59_W2019_021]